MVLNSHGEKSGRKIGMELNTVANYAEAKDKTIAQDLIKKVKLFIDK